MSISGITTTADNGVERITNTQTITGTGTADGETLVLDGSTSTLETGTTSGTVSLSNCCIVIDSDTPTGNDASAVLNYGGRTVTGTTLEIEDSIILINALSARHNIQVTDLRNVLIIEQDGTGEMFVYTKGGGDVIDVIFRDINVWEVYGPPANLANVTVDGASYGYLNWEAGRLDFFNFDVLNITPGAAAAHAWQGTGSTTNACWHWNNGPNFNNQGMYLTAANNHYYEGYTACWRFVDQLSGNPVTGVKVLLRDDFSGSMTLLGTYTTNSNGRLVGTWDSQNRSTGSSIERPVLFLLTLHTANIDTGSPGSYDYPTVVIGGDQGNRSYNYSLDDVQPQVEVRSYLHLAPEGFKAGDDFNPTAEIGKRDTDGTVKEYQDFVLIPDSGVTLTEAQADALTAIADLSDLFDRTKAEWVDNNGYPLPLRDGTKIDTGATTLVIDGDTSTAWAYATGTITIHTGRVSSIERVGATEAISSGVDDEITINFPAGVEEDDVAYIFVGHSESEDNAWNTPSGWTIPTGLTEVQTGGSPTSTPGVSVFRRVLTGSEGSSVTITNVGTNTSGIVAQMIVYRNVNTTTPEDVNPTTASGASGDPDPASITTVNNNAMIIACGFMDGGNQSSPSPPTNYTAIHDTATTDGESS